MFVNESKTNGRKFLYKRDGMNLLTPSPRDADKYETAADARRAGEHFGRQPYVAVSYSSVEYLNRD